MDAELEISASWPPAPVALWWPVAVASRGGIRGYEEEGHAGVPPATPNDRVGRSVPGLKKRPALCVLAKASRLGKWRTC